MKAPQFYITLALGALCLVLSITCIVLGKNNSNLQMQQQQQQEEINKGKVSAQIAQNLIRDMADLSLTNDKIKQVLTANGIRVNPPVPAPSPSATPAASPVK